MRDGGGDVDDLHTLLDYNGAWYGWAGHDEWDGHIFVLLCADYVDKGETEWLIL